MHITCYGLDMELNEGDRVRAVRNATDEGSTGRLARIVSIQPGGRLVLIEFDDTGARRFVLPLYIKHLPPLEQLAMCAP